MTIFCKIIFIQAFECAFIPIATENFGCATYVDVPTVAISFRVGADRRLVSGKVFSGIFHTGLLCAFCGGPLVFGSHGVIDNNIILRFNIMVILI